MQWCSYLHQLWAGLGWLVRREQMPTLNSLLFPKIYRIPITPVRHNPEKYPPPPAPTCWQRESCCFLTLTPLCCELKQEGRKTHTSNKYLEEIVEVVQALAQLPDGDARPQLLGQLKADLTQQIKRNIAEWDTTQSPHPSVPLSPVWNVGKDRKCDVYSCRSSTRRNALLPRCQTGTWRRENYLGSAVRQQIYLFATVVVHVPIVK